MDMVYKPIIKKWIWFTIGFFFIGLVWFSYKMDLVIKIGFGLVSILVMVNQIFCTPLPTRVITFSYVIFSNKYRRVSMVSSVGVS
jgi:hypothetical protein